MVLKEYLREEMYINNEIACAYLKLGHKAADLMTEKDTKVLDNLNRIIKNEI